MFRSERFWTAAGTYLIVRAHDLASELRATNGTLLSEHAGAREFANWVTDARGATLARLLAHDVIGPMFRPPTHDDGRERINQLRRRFERGELRVIHVPVRAVAGFTASVLEVPEPPALGPEAAPEKTWFEIKVVDVYGDPVDGIEVVFTQGMQREKAVTNGNGVARWRDVTGGSFASVKLADAAEVRKVLRPRWAKPLKEPIPDGPGIKKILLGLEEPAASLEGEKPSMLVIAKALTRVRLLGLHFDTDKCFLRRTAMAGIRHVASIYKKNPNGRLLIIGHTDTAGQESYNVDLSVERSEAVKAYLKDDVAAWEDWFGDAKPKTKRWGSAEINDMVLALPCEPSVAGFQTWSNTTRGTDLKVDGNAGPQTRRELIEAYMALDGTTLPASIGAEVHGVGEWFPRKKTEDDVAEPENRRVELLCFDDEIYPPVPGKKGTKGEPEYPQWNTQVTTEIDVQNDDIALSFYLLDNAHRRLAHAAYRLQVGAWNTQGVADEDAHVSTVAPLSSGVAMLEWDLATAADGTPLGYRYAEAIAIDIGDGANDEAIAILRLANLGYPPSRTFGTNLVEFQRDYGLTVAPWPDDATKSALEAAGHTNKEGVHKDAATSGIEPRFDPISAEFHIDYDADEPALA